MLVVDATSSYCDVCLEKYSQGHLAHVLSCGHVFCQPCIRNVQNCQGVVVDDGMNWSAVINDPDFSVDDLPKYAPCPLCRAPFAQYSAHRIQAAYTTSSAGPQSNERGESPQSDTTFATDEGSVDQVGEAGQFGDVYSAMPSSAQTAIKMNLETQVSDIIFEGLGSGSRHEILALNHRIQKWLADEALKGRIEEHVLLRASIQLLMQSLRSR